MIWLDWLILAIVGYNLVTGLFSGFLRSLINLVALVASYLLTPVLKGPVTGIVQASFGLPEYLALPLGTFLTWTGIFVLISFAGMMFSKAVNMTPLAIVDRLAGAAFGLFVSALLVLVPLAAIQALPFAKSIVPLQQTLKASTMVTALQPAVSFVQFTAGPAIVNYWLGQTDQAQMRKSLPQPKPTAQPGARAGQRSGAGAAGKSSPVPRR